MHAAVTNRAEAAGAFVQGLEKPSPMRQNIATAWLQKAAEESLGKSAASRLGLPVNARPSPAADAAAAVPASPSGRRCAALRAPDV
jgi:hypothetical protein